MKGLPQFTLLFLVLFSAAHPVHAQKQKHRSSPVSLQKKQAQAGEYIAADSTRESFKTAERDTSLPVMVFPGEIRQDSILVANYTITDGSWEGKLVKTFTFYLPNGVKAAEAMILGISKDACSITTFKDNKMAQVEINVINNTARVKLLAGYLITNGYL